MPTTLLTPAQALAAKHRAQHQPQTQPTATPALTAVLTELLTATPGGITTTKTHHLAIIANARWTRTHNTPLFTDPINAGPNGPDLPTLTATTGPTLRHLILPLTGFPAPTQLTPQQTNTIHQVATEFAATDKDHLAARMQNNTWQTSRSDLLGTTRKDPRPINPDQLTTFALN